MTARATISVALANETATAQLMADLALLIGPGDVITLSGDLGAGKTAAARAMIRYFAADDALEVPSPTFTLAQTYDLPPFPLLHAELEPSARIAEITGYGKAAATVARLQTLRQFLADAGYADAKRLRMAGDASTRSYARLIRDDGVVILMNSPRRPDGPAIYDGKSYSAAVHLAEDVKPFVAIANGLRERGFSAPAIHHADLNEGFLITEDFGSAGFIEGEPPLPIAERYEAAVDTLALLHRDLLPEILPLAPQITYWIPTFDIDAMMVEIGLMLEWYLPDRGAVPPTAARDEFVTQWRDLLGKTAALPKTWTLRDFHSPNLIWLAERSGISRVGLIDFQDAVLGLAAYDLVSLLQDARIDVPEQLELSLLTRYIKARHATDNTFDP